MKKFVCFIIVSIVLMISGTTLYVVNKLGTEETVVVEEEHSHTMHKVCQLAIAYEDMTSDENGNLYYEDLNGDIHEFSHEYVMHELERGCTHAYIDIEL